MLTARKSDEKSDYIMNARRHDAGSFDWDSDDSDFANMPELLDKNSSAVSSDDNSTSSRPIARKKKVVLVSNASDDNESMGKLFASNLKVAVDEMAESNSCAIKLAENIAELKLAGLRVCTSYAEKLDESSACNSEPRIVTRRSAPSPFRTHCARLRSTTSQLRRISMRACP